jgi:tryptophan synthase alpha chain
MASASATTLSDPIAERIRALRDGGRCALIPYITAGYPDREATPALLDVVARYADLIELGVPFSDPVADGPTIQRSSQRALEHGVTLPWTLSILRDFHARHATPVVLFSYLNPVMAYGVERFIDDAVEAGAAGVVLTDLPAGSDPGLETRFEESPLALIRFIAPTTPASRIEEIARRAQGFLYYISRLGVTGARADVRSGLAAELDRLRKLTPIPVAVGFGISTPEQAAEVARSADAIVVGSAVIDALDRGGAHALDALLAALHSALGPTDHVR